jgi:flagellar basal body rod protein FlgC
MQIQSGFNTSVYGLQKASEGITKNAEDIASQSLSNDQQQTGFENKQQAEQVKTLQDSVNEAKPSSTTENLVSLLENRNNAQANIKALQSQSEILGNIIDIKA